MGGLKPQLVIKDDGTNLEKIRSLPARRWSSQAEAWFCPYVKEVYDDLLDKGFPVNHIPRPSVSGYRVDAALGRFQLYTLGRPADVQAAKSLPGHRTFSSGLEAWLVTPNRSVVEYIRSRFPQAEWSQAANDLALTTQRAPVPQVVKPSIPTQDDFKFYSKPYDHQREAFYLSRDRPYFGLLMEQGTGKSKVTIDTAAWLYGQGKITGLLIVTMNAGKENWADEELTAHLDPSIPRDVHVWSAYYKQKAEDWVYKAPGKSRPLRVLVMNAEAIGTPVGEEVAKLFLSKHTCLFVVDESTMFKSISAKRTRALLRLGNRAPYRRILTGTPLHRGVLGLFPQMKFLSEGILGHSNQFSFRNHYCIMGGWNNKQIIGYANLEELTERIAPHTFRVLKKDCLDLPDKVYEKWAVDMSPNQKQIYDSLKQDLLAEWAGEKITVTHVLTQLTLLQRVTGGFFPYEHDVNGELHRDVKLIEPTTPKLEQLKHIIEEFVPPDGKVIIWARFVAELQWIALTLREIYGDDSVVEYHGKISKDQKLTNRRIFQASGGPRFFAGQAQSAGRVLTLTSANTVIYYSNDFDLENRDQSEDRAHRISQVNKVTYHDLVVRKTLDPYVLTKLRNKLSLSNTVLKDPPRNWI